MRYETVKKKRSELIKQFFFSIRSVNQKTSYNIHFIRFKKKEFSNKRTCFSLKLYKNDIEAVAIYTQQKTKIYTHSADEEQLS